MIDTAPNTDQQRQARQGRQEKRQDATAHKNNCNACTPTNGRTEQKQPTNSRLSISISPDNNTTGNNNRKMNQRCTNTLYKITRPHGRSTEKTQHQTTPHTHQRQHVNMSAHHHQPQPAQDRRHACPSVSFVFVCLAIHSQVRSLGIGSPCQSAKDASAPWPAIQHRSARLMQPCLKDLCTSGEHAKSLHLAVEPDRRDRRHHARQHPPDLPPAVPCRPCGAAHHRTHLEHITRVYKMQRKIYKISEYDPEHVRHMSPPCRVNYKAMYDDHQHQPASSARALATAAAARNINHHVRQRPKKRQQR